MLQAALRIDDETGLEERLEHIPTPRGLLYTWSAKPRDSTAGVVICSSIAGDFTANYHRERLLGLHLASRGLGAIRFHYSGDGNSQGDRRDMTFQTMCLDAGAVVASVGSMGLESIGLVGTRIGALVAATVGSQLPGAPLVLWEPVVDTGRFVREAQRAKRMSAVAQQAAAEPPQRPDGVLDALGYDMYPPLLESLEDLDLPRLLSPAPRPVLIGSIGSRTVAGDTLARTLSDGGFDVQTGAFGLTESWWFENEFAPETGNLITETAAWLDRRLAEAT